MQRRALLAAVILLAACADPNIDDFEGLWQLTALNGQALPAPVPGGGGTLWVAAVLQVGKESGSFDVCSEDPSTSNRTSQSSFILVAPIRGDRMEVSYFDRRDGSTDTASVDGGTLTLRSRTADPATFNLLTFVPLSGALPPACSLAP
jgi:hypothetical protein